MSEFLICHDNYTILYVDGTSAELLFPASLAEIAKATTYDNFHQVYSALKVYGIKNCYPIGVDSYKEVWHRKNLGRNVCFSDSKYADDDFLEELNKIDL